MVSPQLVKDTIASKLPDAHVEVQDLIFIGFTIQIKQGIRIFVRFS